MTHSSLFAHKSKYKRKLLFGVSMKATVDLCNLNSKLKFYLCSSFSFRRYDEFSHSSGTFYHFWRNGFAFISTIWHWFYFCNRCLPLCDTTNRILLKHPQTNTPAAATKNQTKCGETQCRHFRFFLCCQFVNIDGLVFVFHCEVALQTIHPVWFVAFRFDR